MPRRRTRRPARAAVGLTAFEQAIVKARQGAESYVPPVGEVMRVKNLQRPVWVVRMEPQQLVEYAKQPSFGPTVEARTLLADLANGRSHWGGILGAGGIGSDNGLGGARNLAEIDSVFENGWPEGADRARWLMSDIGQEVPPAVSTRRRRVVKEDGTDPIVEAWLDKDLPHLFESRKPFATQGHKVIQIALGWGGNCFMTSEQLFWGGAAALVLTEQLEAAGYGVEVHAYAMISGGWSDAAGDTLYDVVVKPSDQPIAVDTFAAMTAHAGVYRAYALGMLGHAPWGYHEGLGRNEQIDGYAPALVEAEVIPEIEILLPNVYTRELAIEAIRRGLQDIAEKYGEVY